MDTSIDAADAAEWIVPNYSFVEIYEYEMEIEKRRRTEDFCIQFFKDWETDRDVGADSTSNSKLLVHICRHIIKEEKLCKVVKDLPNYYLTLCNFNAKFQTMCTLLFKEGTRDEYVVSLLAFCIELHKEMQDCATPWYNWKLLITSLADALERANFNPRTFNYDQSGSALLQSIITSFIAIVPSLLFFYVLLR